MMLSYEREHEFHYKYIVRARPDLLILNSAPPLQTLGVQHGRVAIPHGIVVGHNQLNDHLVVASRADAHVYFNTVDRYLACKDFWNFWQDDAGPQLAVELRSAGVRADQALPLQYTIFRPCPVGAECDRLRSEFMKDECRAISQRICRTP